MWYWLVRRSQIAKLGQREPRKRFWDHSQIFPVHGCTVMASAPVAAASTAETAVVWQQMIRTSLQKNKRLPYSKCGPNFSRLREHSFTTRKPLGQTVMYRRGEEERSGVKRGGYTPKCREELAGKGSWKGGREHRAQREGVELGYGEGVRRAREEGR